MSLRPLRLASGVTALVIGPGQVATVGRAEHCSLVVDDPRVSRSHASVSATADGWLFDDQGSTGGTWRNGKRVERLLITEPIEVRLGDAVTGPVLRLEPHTAEAPADARETIVASAGTARAPSGIFAGSHEPRPTTRIGRADDNDVVVDDLLVSRYHAEIRSTASGFEIVDVGSRNGTFLNGRQVHTATIRELDLVAIGHHLFRLSGGRLEEYADSGEATFAAVGLSATASGHLLLNDISFTVNERTLLAIVGPSGSGKSSLLAALSGLRPAGRGQVLYGGRDLYEDYAELRTRIGFVPQEDVLHRELTVRATLAYAGRLRFPADVTAAEAGARIDELLAELGVAHREQSPLHQLSGGERKRINVASELLTKPSLLFLDEPTAGLDPGIARVLMLMLRDLADGGRTVVVVTHDIANLDVCDQLLVLAPGGTPAYFGPPAEAASHFGRATLSAVYRDLATQSPETWRTDRVDPADPSPMARHADVPERARQSRRSWWSQLATLTHRSFAVLAADRRNTALMLLQAPVLGLLLLAALPAGELSIPPPSEVRFVSVAGLVLFVLVLAATWVGANNATREIAREVPILKRERAVGLSLSAYVVSKAVVLGGFTIVQSVVLVALATARQRGPAGAVILGSGQLELTVIVILAALASMAIGLALSAAAGTPERASTLLPMILILQLVLSAGVMIPQLVDKPVLRELSLASSAQWGVAGAASTTDLNSLQLFDDRLRELRTVDAADPSAAVDVLLRDASPAKRWAHTRRAWLTAAGVLVVLTLVPLCATRLVLRRYDPGG